MQEILIPLDELRKTIYASKVPLTVVSADSGVPYSSLRAFMTCHTGKPSLDNYMSLVKYVNSKKVKS